MVVAVTGSGAQDTPENSIRKGKVHAPLCAAFRIRTIARADKGCQHDIHLDFPPQSRDATRSAPGVIAGAAARRRTATVDIPRVAIAPTRGDHGTARTLAKQGPVLARDTVSCTQKQVDPQCGPTCTSSDGYRSNGKRASVVTASERPYRPTAAQAAVTALDSGEPLP